MADTKHHAAAAAHGPTEGDGVSYRGIVWFVAILAVTTMVCQGLMWWMLRYEQGQQRANDTPRAEYAAPVLQPPPPPNLISLNSQEMPLGEPTNLQRFREGEDQVLTTYGWIDKNDAIVRIPIDRAKELILQRGLPTRAK